MLVNAKDVIVIFFLLIICKIFFFVTQKPIFRPLSSKKARKFADKPTKSVPYNVFSVHFESSK